MEDLGPRLRALGKRLTHQRQRVLATIGEHPHSTPEQIVGYLEEQNEPDLATSTVYRAIEALEGLGMVTHTHLDHNAPSYHLAEHPDHIHLVCRSCGAVLECEPELATEFVTRIRAELGFDAEVTHMAVHGRCAQCAPDGQARP